MTTTIKVTKTARSELWASVWLDILVGDEYVGEATLSRYYWEDAGHEYTHLERIDIDKDFRNKGYGRAAIDVMCKTFGRIVAAPDSDNSERLFARIGDIVDRRDDMEESHLDIGWGVYEFR